MKLILAIFSKMLYVDISLFDLNQPSDPKLALVEVIRVELKGLSEERETNSFSRKIEAIKVLRRPEVSRFMLDHNLVTKHDLNEDGIIGLGAAKTWVENNCPLNMIS